MKAPNQKFNLTLTRAECQTLLDALEDGEPPDRTVASRYQELRRKLVTSVKGLHQTRLDEMGGAK